MFNYPSGGCVVTELVVQYYIHEGGNVGNGSYHSHKLFLSDLFRYAHGADAIPFATTAADVRADIAQIGVQYTSVARTVRAKRARPIVAVRTRIEEGRVVETPSSGQE